jgi:tripartite-type tricarboxylate transporter receptor subunit TctC
MTIDSPPRRRLLGAAGLAALAPALAPTAARAQAFPSRPLRLFVGYSAGGGVDAVARLVATGLSAAWGQQVVVENRAGASGLIAAEAVSKAAPDGHTLIVGETGLLIASLLRGGRALDPLKALAPVAGLCVSPLLIIANNGVPMRSPAELVQQLKANPGRYSYATSGIGTVQHLGFEMLKARTGAFVVHIPYRGAAQIVPDVIGGQVPLGVVSATAGLAQARAGKLRALALMSPVKLPGADEVQPLASALPGFDVAPRLALMAPAGTPQPLIDAVAEATRKVLAAPETVQALLQQGVIAAFMPPAELGRDLQRELADWDRVIKDRKIVAE